MQVDAQRIRRSRRQCGQLRQRLGRLRWGVQVGPADAREAPQVRDHGRPQFGEQVIDRRDGIGVQQERLDHVEGREEALRQFDAMQRLTALLGRPLAGGRGIRRFGGRAPLLQLANGHVGIDRAAGGHVGQSALRIIEQ